MPKLLTEPDIRAFRDRLCRAAARLFAERGRDGVTMRALATAVGVSAMTPYRYFRDKDDILAAVRADAFDRFAAALENAYETDGDLAERTVAVGEAYVRFAFSEPTSYRLMFDLSQPDEEQYPDLVRATERARKTMTAYVRALVDEKILAGDPELIGHVMWASLHGVVVLQLAGKLTPQCSFETVRSEAFRALVRGFSPAGAQN